MIQDSTLIHSDPNELYGKRVLLLGLGVNQGGIGIARYLCRSGADVRVTDLQPEETLAHALRELDGLPIDYSLGGHKNEDIDWAEVVVRNPGVPTDSPWLQRARANQARIEMEMTLFFRACRGSIIGITGTKGKTTTATMLANILRRRQPGTVLAGNMGRSALDELPNIDDDTIVVIELSSFQLEGLDEHHLGPNVAVITNISPDHLDRYPSFDQYVRTKTTIYRHQPSDGWQIHRRDNAVVHRHIAPTSAHLATFGPDPIQSDYATGIENKRFSGRWDGNEIDLGPVDDLHLPGQHARLNFLAAATAALAVGTLPASIQESVHCLEPVQDRLETVTSINDVVYVNDTTATVPEAAIAALEAFEDGRLIVIAGGSEKHLDLSGFADALVTHATRVILLDGAATVRLKTLLNDRNYTPIDGPYDTMQAAVKQAAASAASGDIVLLSPGCASFGMFQNEFERGKAFRAAVYEFEKDVA